MKKLKRVLAMVGVILILAMYVVTMYLAITANKHTAQFFMTSLVLTIFIPLLIYVLELIYKLLGKKEDDIQGGNDGN